MIDLSYRLDSQYSDNVPEYLHASQDLLEMGQIATLALVDVMLNQSERPSCRAARLLAETNNPDIIPAFILALRSPYPLIRQIAAQTLGTLGDKSVVPYLLERLSRTEILTQLWIIEALGNLQDSRAIYPLLELLATTESQAIQHAIVKALGRIGNPIVAEGYPQLMAFS